VNAHAAVPQARRPLPPFTEEHGELRASVRRFVARELRPHATAWEDARWFPAIGAHIGIATPPIWKLGA